MQKSKDRYHRKVEQTHNTNIMSAGIAIPAGVYFGLVVENVDPNQLERVKVHISSLYSSIVPSDSSGSTPSDGYLGAVWCQRIMPYGGTTGNSSFGLLGPPPNPGDEVLVAFSGDSDRGIILGTIPDVRRYGNTVGPVSRLTQDGEFLPANEPSPTAETPDEPPEAHPLAESIREQGLDQDAVRGQNFSSHTRDPASRVFGISSPNGHSFVMDDGRAEDDNFNLVRLRTAGGSQILMDDNSGFIYIINRNGSGWIEINRNGDFDIFSGGNINIHTTGEFNVHADGNVNFQGDKGVNIKAGGGEGVKIQAAGGSIDLHAQSNANITADANGNLSIAGNLRMSSGRIDLNGPAADVAAKPTIAQLGENTGVTQSISGRVPEREPWRGHLDQPSVETTGPRAGEIQSAPQGSSAADLNNDFAASAESLGNGTITWRSGVNRRVNPELLNKFESIIRAYGRPVIITSGYRTPSTNRGASNSRHLRGDAIDFQHSDGSPFSRAQVERLVELASQNGILGVGVYPTPRGNVTSSNAAYLMHFDLGRSGRVSWGHTFGRVSTPVFARPVLSRFGYY